MRWLFRALLPAANIAPAVSLHTKESLSWRVLFFYDRAALPSRPVHRWRAWLLFFVFLTLSRRALFFWLAGQKLVKKNQLSFFLGKKLGKYWG
jgi:hypothetical protein